VLFEAPEVAQAVIGRLDPNLTAKFIRNLDGKTQYALYSRLPITERRELTAKMGFTVEKFSALTEKQQFEALGKVAPEQLAKMVGVMSREEMSQALGKADLQFKTDVMSALTREERIIFMEAAPRPVQDELQRALGEMGQRSIEQQ